MRVEGWYGYVSEGLSVERTRKRKEEKIRAHNSLFFPFVPPWSSQGMDSGLGFLQRINFRGSVTCDQLDSRDEWRSREAMPPSQILSGFNIMLHLHNKFSFFVLHVPWLRVLHIIQF